MQPKPHFSLRFTLFVLIGAALLSWLLLTTLASPTLAQTPTPTPTLVSTAPAPSPTPAPTPNDVQRAMYFNSTVRDAANCDVTLSDGEVGFGPAITNPAMSCPDAFAWRLLIRAIQEGFWENWAADQYTWPAAPLPLCTGDETGNCCNPNSFDNPYVDPDNGNLQCPYYPGDHLDTDQPPTLLARPPFKAQTHHFALADLDITPGRTIRQEMAELVYRNKPMFDYVFANNLYNREGVAAVFAQNANNQKLAAPYRLDPQQSATATIDFPVDSVMVKSNWLSQERAEALGLDNDPANPYITMEITQSILDNDAKEEKFQAGLYYLVALHISSKDIPNWVWATFEHVNNPGRCDYTGCNDAFGYHSPDAVAAGQADNFTQPLTVSDGLVGSSTIFATGQRYPGGELSAALDDILDGLGIGNQDQADPTTPTVDARGWRGYRLKGSQVNFTDATGRPNRLGNSITEGGFVNSSSCMGCHARASVDANGGSPLGVFIAELSETGYPQAALMPDPDWYYSSATDPQLEALQTDFVWGFLFANHIVTSTQGITNTQGNN